MVASRFGQKCQIHVKNSVLLENKLGIYTAADHTIIMTCLWQNHKQTNKHVMCGFWLKPCPNSGRSKGGGGTNLHVQGLGGAEG